MVFVKSLKGFHYKNNLTYHQPYRISQINRRGAGERLRSEYHSILFYFSDNAEKGVVVGI